MKLSHFETQLFKLYNAPFWFHYFYNKAIPDFVVEAFYEGRKTVPQLQKLLDSVVLDEEFYQTIKLCSLIYGPGYIPQGLQNKIDQKRLEQTSIDNFSFYPLAKSFKIEEASGWLIKAKQSSVFNLFNSLKFNVKHKELVDLALQDPEIIPILEEIKIIITNPSRKKLS